MGEVRKQALRVGFDGSLKLEFHGSKVVSGARYVTFQMAEVAVPRGVFKTILEGIQKLRPPEAVRG